MKLLLTLLALLTGFAGADRAVVAASNPSALGAVVALAEVAAQREAIVPAHRPVAQLPALADSSDCPDRLASLDLPTVGVLTGIDRARE